MLSMCVIDTFAQFMDDLKPGIHQKLPRMLPPWHRPRQCQPRQICILHIGAKLMQAQAMVGTVVAVVVAVLVDGKGNLG